MGNKRGLVNQTITELLTFIKAQNYRVGQKLPKEADLAELLGVGRSTLREAVKILSFSDVLDVRQGSGTYLKNTSFKEDFSTEELLAARQMLELQAVRLVIQKDHKVETMLHLKELLFQRNQLLEAGKFSEYVIQDMAFHKKIIDLTSNPFLVKWYHEIEEAIRLYLSGQILKVANYQDNTRFHNQLYQALVDKDVELAEQMIIANNGFE
ncbi:FadR/GntR family transcriptional regulator [Candidatus Enterococcus ferrettii]|uniref:HTH gntR-type domain-containing protein n=1 Tax=Candidatus Enterococcus ferrettii TaxID=2815324 RepID=A0ABV0EK31_9ENTE|nr:FCD domain-containing protein [Enterococcus sp. 665A]MBO1338617.1 FadR family transcriptional regulator [Enterococcus sp. 665A]